MDWEYAPAYHEMAKLYMSLNTVDDHWRAEIALTKAMRLAPGNMECELTLGDLRWAAGLRYDAERQYKKVLEADSTNTRAAYALYERAGGWGPWGF